MAQTKADRQAAAKKAAATRERNRVRNASQERGRKAATSRLTNQASRSLEDSKRAANSAATNVGGAAKSIGSAAVNAGKAVASRVGIGSR